MQLRQVTLDRLEETWPSVEIGLKQILKRCPGNTWTPEDVYWRIVRNQCWLFAGDDGFFVVERCVETHTEAWYLNVWCLYFKPGKARAYLVDTMAQLDEMRAKLFCKYIQFSSPRLGWGRAMAEHFKLHICIWRREK